MLIFLTAAWLVGLLLGILAEAPALPLFLLASAGLPLGLLLVLSRWPVFPVVLAVLLLLAFWRVEVSEKGLPDPAGGDGRAAALTGWVRDTPRTAGGMVKFPLSGTTIDFGNGPDEFRSQILVYAQPPESLVSSREPPFFAYGDALTLEGALTTPDAESEPGWATYLSSRGISGVFWSRSASLNLDPNAEIPASWQEWLPSLRQQMANSLDGSLPLPQSALAKALLLGLRDDVPSRVVDDFRKTGTAHLLAISGMHVSVLLMMVLGLAALAWGRRPPLYVLAPLVAIWFYVLLSGAPVSAIRAGTMGTILLAGWTLGRPHRVLPALGLAASVMAGLEPEILRQVSFQLSFAAVAGIGLVLPFQSGINSYLEGKLTSGWPSVSSWYTGVVGWIASAGLVSLGATLATWPLVAFYFDIIPWLGIPATMLVLPALPVALAGAVATSIVGMTYPPAGEAVGWIAWIPLSYILRVADWTPHLTSPGNWVTPPLVVAWYLVMIGLVLLPRGAARIARRLGWRPELAPVQPPALAPAPSSETGGVWTRLGPALTALGLAAAVMLWWQVFTGPDGRLHVHFFDVGQGDSSLIITPSGKQILVDGGPGFHDAVRNLSQVMPPGDRSIDLVVLTHLDADHSRGLFEVLNRFNVGLALVGVDHAESPMLPQWKRVLERAGLTALPVELGYRIILEPEVFLEVLNPPPTSRRFPSSDLNNNGVTLRLIYGNIRMLLAADIEGDAEVQLAQSGIPLASHVLKVPHHGSRTSSTTVFLEAVDPVVAVISAGEDNQYGHPAPSVVSRLETFVGEQGIFRTDRDGSIEFTADGRRLWVETR